MQTSQSKFFSHICAISFLFLLFILPFSHSGMKWREPAHFSSPLIGAPIISYQTVYALATDGIVYSVDISDGSVQVAYDAGAPTHVPMALGEYALIFGSDEGKIEARSLSKGNLLWRYPNIEGGKGGTALIPGQEAYMPNDQPSSSNTIVNHTLRHISASEGVVYAVYDNALVAIDEQSGREIFSPRALSNGYSVFAQSKYIFVSDGESLAAFSREGTPLWSAFSGPLFKTHPYYSEESGLAYVAGTNGLLMAFEAQGGKLRWNYPLNGWLMSTPAGDGTRVLVGANDGKVRAFGAKTGELLWQSDAFGPVWGEPAMLDAGEGKIAVYGTNNNSLVAYNMEDGTLLFNYQASGWVSSPAISSDRRTVVFSASDNSLWAIDAWPICTIDYPRTGQFIPPEAEISGRAFSPRGAKIIRLWLNGEAIPDIVLGDAPTFSYLADLNSQPIGSLHIQCLAEDADGLKEEDLLFFKAEPVISTDAPKLGMGAHVSQPSLSAGEKFTLYVKNEQGGDLGDVLVEIAGKNYSYSSPAQINAPLAGGQYDIVARKTGYAPATVQIEVSSGFGIIQALLIVLAILVGIVLYLKFGRRMEVKFGGRK